MKKTFEIIIDMAIMFSVMNIMFWLTETIPALATILTPKIIFGLSGVSGILVAELWNHKED